MNPQSIGANNYSKLRLSLFILPLLMLAEIGLFLYSQGAINSEAYIQIQKDSFFKINAFLGQFPNLEYNLTQLGDAFVFISLISVFILNAPKVWGALLSGLLVSLLFSLSLKRFFSVPRPAAIFGTDSFIIVGKKLTGFNSLPSGHSITIFTMLTILLFAYMPYKQVNKVVWSFIIILLGMIVASSRVGVGAHYPFDVIIGSIIGYISGLAGIFISRNMKFSFKKNQKKYLLFLIIIFLICWGMLLNKILKENLPIYYFSLAGLTASLYKLISTYAKK